MSKRDFTKTIFRHCGARAIHKVAQDRGQALPLALVALAVGTVLVAPFLTNVSVNLLASRKTDEAIADYYSTDAGIEWGLWRLKNDPTLTTSSTYTETPLQPTPATINSDAFPTTEIRFASGAGASETITPAWQSGGGPQCYPLTSTDSGSVFVIIETAASTVRADLRSSCTGGSLPDLIGASPYTLEFPGQPAGTYQVVVQTVPPTSGTLTINYPIVSYDLRSQRDGRTITARATASTNAVTIISWQLD
ncbi:MAG: hypothetical protein IIA23_00610 [Chloroflexi bacterium]|nr:hypothetical protein [Chloroflexota bacterium]